MLWIRPYECRGEPGPADEGVNRQCFPCDAPKSTEIGTGEPGEYTDRYVEQRLICE